MIPYLNYIKWGALALLLIVLGVQTYRVATRDTTIAEQKVDLEHMQSNCTQQERELDLFQKDQQITHTATLALQAQVNTGHNILSEWQARSKAQDKIIAQLRNQPAGPLQAAKEVLTDEGSSLALHDLDSLYDAAGMRRQAGDSGGPDRSPGEVHGVQAPSDPRP